MANNSQIKALINEKITTNGTGAITGLELNNVLTQMVLLIGQGRSFAGIATPSGTPATYDSNVFWLATAAGTYTNFGGVAVSNGLSMILYTEVEGVGSYSVQPLLTIDSTPTQNSNHLVLSSGVYTAMQEIASSITVTGNDKGVYTSEANLLSVYPSPEVGWKALVGDSSPLALYICETRGTWEDSGMTVALEYEALISDVKVNGVSVVNAAKVANITIPEVTVDGETLIF